MPIATADAAKNETLLRTPLYVSDDGNTVLMGEQGGEYFNPGTGIGIHMEPGTFDAPVKVTLAPVTDPTTHADVPQYFNGVSNSRVRDVLLKRYSNVGVGYYPNSYHVHLDVRSRQSFWIDYSGAGEEAQYARNPHADLRRGLARRGVRPKPHRARGRARIRAKGRRR